MVDRPDIHDPEVLCEVAKELAPKVMAWDPNGEYDLEELAESLQKGMEDAYDLDAYKIVRALDDDGWMVDAELVHVFEEAIPIALRVRDRLIEQWVKDESVTATLKVGDKVQSKRRFNRYSGTITRVDEKSARYLVFNPVMGHVETGVGTHGIWAPFEDVEEVRDDSGDQRGGR
jgi:hypothetical protein